MNLKTDGLEKIADYIRHRHFSNNRLYKGGNMCKESIKIFQQRNKFIEYKLQESLNKTVFFWIVHDNDRHMTKLVMEGFFISNGNDRGRDKREVRYNFVV